MRASFHPRQAERLGALRSYGILDTPRESDFDDVVKLAASICGTPISVMNLIDADRQWFKAEVGLAARETPLETSICSHVILENDFTMIEDTHCDPRTADNELCTPDDGLRFYAGALLKTESGLPIGTLCVLDTKPNSLDHHQKEALRILARRIMRELELRRALRAQDVLNDEIDHRVKNSFSSISGAIRLYKREALETGDVGAGFDAVQRQLDAVAAVHKSIYLSGHEGGVELKTYLSVLADRLEASLPDGVFVNGDGPDINVPTAMASMVGLIANEFSANTLKHGKKGKGEVRIDVHVSHECEELIVRCSNNVPRSSDESHESNGIGARLMKASVAQQGGHLRERDIENGFEITAVVPSDILSVH